MIILGLYIKKIQKNVGIILNKVFNFHSQNLKSMSLTVWLLFAFRNSYQTIAEISTGNVDISTIFSRFFYPNFRLKWIFKILMVLSERAGLVPSKSTNSIYN